MSLGNQNESSQTALQHFEACFEESTHANRSAPRAEGAEKQQKKWQGLGYLIHHIHLGLTMVCRSFSIGGKF